MGAKRKFDLWTGVSLVTLGFFCPFPAVPLWGLLRQSVLNAQGQFTLEYFKRFFQYRYYTVTIINSIKVSLAITLVTLILGIPFLTFIHSTSSRVPSSCLLSVCCVPCRHRSSAPMPGCCSWGARV